MTESELAIRVRAPSRLHFGLLAFGADAFRQFGGVGVMIDRPETEVYVRVREVGQPAPKTVSAAERRAYQFAQRFRDSLESPEERERVESLEIRVAASAPEHVGLGSGSQLAMAVARALAACVGRSDAPAQELAQRVGRGARSAIGVHGFQVGGFIVDGGKHEAQQVAPLVARLNFPEEWHFLLVIGDDSKGRHGSAENEAFDSLAPISAVTTAELCRLILLGMLPSVAEHDFQSFSESLREFGRKVGECFATHQGGVYASALADALIDILGRHGVRGIAQSSWGPTLAAVCDSRFRAEWLAARLADSVPRATRIFCAGANNLGAKIEVTVV